MPRSREKNPLSKLRPEPGQKELFLCNGALDHLQYIFTGFEDNISNSIEIYYKGTNNLSKWLRRPRNAELLAKIRRIADHADETTEGLRDHKIAMRPYWREIAMALVQDEYGPYRALQEPGKEDDIDGLGAVEILKVLERSHSAWKAVFEAPAWEPAAVESVVEAAAETAVVSTAEVVGDDNIIK